MRRLIEKEAEKLQAMRLEAMSGKAIAYDAVHVQSPHPGGMPQVEKLVDKERSIRVLAYRRRKMIRKIRAELSEMAEVDKVFATLLQLRYVEDLSFEAVADRMGYTERHIYRLHEKALKAFTSWRNTRRKRCHTMSD